MNNIEVPSKGGVECSICGLHYSPDSPDDLRTHEAAHQSLMRGGLPLKVREFLKTFGWAVAYDDGGLQRLPRQDPETGKRAVVLAYWARARANGIPDDQLEAFMDAHFAFVDAKVARDEHRIDAARVRIRPWERFAG